MMTLLILLLALLASVEAQCSGGTAMSGADGACAMVNGVGTCCSNNACCSQYGYCGTSADHCGTNCQSAFGRCDGTAQTPCVAGQTWSSSGFAPCSNCGTCSGSPTAQCTTTSNTVCPTATSCVNGQTWSASGNSPCQTCSTCPNGITPSTQCTKTSDTVCPPACVAGQTWSSTGYSPCTGCSTCSNGSPTTQCTATSNTVCPTACVAGQTWSSTGNSPCQACTTCPNGAAPTSQCTRTSNAVCPGCVISTDTACGSNGAGKCCPSGTCCSEYGWCGTTPAHCGGNCQPAFGTCSGNTVTPCVAGQTWSASGNAPCQTCSTCGSNSPITSCSTTTDTVCPAEACVAGQTWSSTGNSPCQACSTCSSGVRNACTRTTNTECNPVQCVAGSTWSVSGNSPCQACTSCSNRQQSCTRTSDTVCASSGDWKQTEATCFGDYQAILGAGVKSGYTAQLPWTSWQYTTAAKYPWSQWAGQCYAVKCISGSRNSGQSCPVNSPTVMIRVIDQLGSDHGFDISTLPMSQIGTQGCNGYLNINYKPISCNYAIGPTTNQIVKNDGSTQSGIAIVLPNGAVDSWQPRFTIDNAAAAIASVKAETGLLTHTLTRFDGEYGAWKSTTGAGQWNNINSNGNEIRFTIDYCDFSKLPDQCVPANNPVVGILAAGWCPGGGVCPAGYFMLGPGPINFAAIFPSTSGVVSSFQMGIGIWVSVVLALVFALI